MQIRTSVLSRAFYRSYALRVFPFTVRVILLLLKMIAYVIICKKLKYYFRDCFYLFVMVVNLKFC